MHVTLVISLQVTETDTLLISVILIGTYSHIEDMRKMVNCTEDKLFSKREEIYVRIYFRNWNYAVQL